MRTKQTRGFSSRFISIASVAIPNRLLRDLTAGGMALLWLCAMPVLAQNAPSSPSPTGYEDLVAAGKLIAASKPLQDAVQPNATLQQKRLATIDDKMDQGLRTLRDWLNRPDRSEPPGALSDLPLETMSQLRMLARALAVEQYVFLASGRVGAAIDSARDGLRMSYAIKPNTLILWLVSEAVDVTVTRTISRHLEQLSQKDCESLLALAKDWMAAPDPTPAMLDTERKQAIEGLKAEIARGQPVAVGAPPAGDDTPPELQHLSKADLDALWPQVVASLDRMYMAFKAELRRPLWERQQALPQASPQSSSQASPQSSSQASPQSSSQPSQQVSARPAQDDKKLALADRMAGNMFALMRPTLERVLESRGKQQARARLAGCHAAIRNYKWEHDSLPKSLDELKLGDMATDPFTGQPFIYKPNHDRAGYVLQSAGPPVRDEQNNIKPGERQSFGLSP